MRRQFSAESGTGWFADGAAVPRNQRTDPKAVIEIQSRRSSSAATRARIAAMTIWANCGKGRMGDGVCVVVVTRAGDDQRAIAKRRLSDDVVKKRVDHAVDDWTITRVPSDAATCATSRLEVGFIVRLPHSRRGVLELNVCRGAVAVAIPAPVQTWAASSVGRAPRSQRGGREFEPPAVHQPPLSVARGGCPP